MLTAQRTSRVVSKRKFREHGISYASYNKHKSVMGSLGNPKLASQRDPPAYTMQKVKAGWTELIAACPVVNQSFDMSFGSVTAASSGGGGTQLPTTTTKSYDPTIVC